MGKSRGRPVSKPARRKRKATPRLSLPPALPVPHQIVRHIIHQHFDALGYRGDPKSWPRHLSKNTGIALGTSRNLLGADKGRPRQPTDNVLEALARHFSGLPQFGGLTGSQIGNAKDLGTFLTTAVASAQALRELTVALHIRRRNSVDAIAQELVGTYVAYHHAFESRSPDVLVSREVLHIERRGDHFPFRMAFEVGINARRRVLFFQGEVMPLGKSAVCVGTSTPFNNPQQEGWVTDLDRGRALFFRRNIDPAVNDLAKFGILATTRHDGNFEPCAACTVLVKVQASISDLDDFFQRVAVVGPYDEIIGNDFAGAGPPEDAGSGKSLHETLASMLDNVPRVEEWMSADTGERAHSKDKVLKLWHDRFSRAMPEIVRAASNRSETAAPFKSNWEQCGNLAR